MTSPLYFIWQTLLACLLPVYAEMLRPDTRKYLCFCSRPSARTHCSVCTQVIRIQPNESIYLKINNKVPGLGLNLDVQKLDLSYKTRYNKHLPDAYERLILDVINGDKRLFIRNDELEAAWDLFTPILKVSPTFHA